MSVQRYDLDLIREEIIPCEGGDYVKHSDHLAALEAQHKEMLEFAVWYSREILAQERGADCPWVWADGDSFNNAHQYWLDNVKNKLTNP